MAYIEGFKTFIKDQKNKGYKVLSPKNAEENLNTFSTPKEFSTGSAKLIKDDELKIYNIKPDCEKSEFGYFLDGIERKKVFVVNNLPVIFGYVSAVILKREDKTLLSDNMFYENQSFYLPYKEIGDEPDHYFEKEEVEVLSPTNLTQASSQNNANIYPIYPAECEAAAHSLIQTQRGEFEKKLVKDWLDRSFDNWLFVDGRLEPVNKYLSANSKIAGIIKSHNRNYFDYSEQIKIYSLKKGQRTSVFIPDNKNVYSWYLRLHNTSQNGNNDFGIIRVEVPKFDNFMEIIDTISNWIMLETKPVAFPASRWDRMIYPIKYCEDYLKSKAPTRSQIESLI